MEAPNVVAGRINLENLPKTVEQQTLAEVKAQTAILCRIEALLMEIADNTSPPETPKAGKGKRRG